MSVPNDEHEKFLDMLRSQMKNEDESRISEMTQEEFQRMLDEFFDDED